MKKIAIFLAATLSLGACQKEKPNIFDGQAGIHFYRQDYASAGAQRDSLMLAFYAKQVAVGQSYGQKIDMRTMGIPGSAPRSFALVQTNVGDEPMVINGLTYEPAVAGKHYVPFTDAQMVELMKIPAGAVQHTFPIKLINDPELTTKMARLVLEVKPNENFVNGLAGQTRFVINFGNLPVEPTSWPDWRSYFGPWSAVKMAFISETLDIYDFDEVVMTASLGQMSAWNRSMLRAIAAYNAAHPELPGGKLDENDNPVTFPVLGA